MSGEAIYAAPPFDHAKADVILRSSDNIDFRVFKLFLSLASPVFETLFQVPQPTQASADQEVKDGLAVIPVAEDSRTLDALLCYCYPSTLTDDPELETLEDVLNVLQASRKYTFDLIEKRVAHAFSNPKILESESLRCFALARQRQMQEETLIAAKYTLAEPPLPSWFREINLITAGDLLALLTYHKECGNAVYALRADMSWIISHYGSSQGCAWLSGKYPRAGYSDYASCSCPRSPKPRYKLFEKDSLQWWEAFMEAMFAALRERPCGAIVASLAAKTTQEVKSLNCTNCSAKVTEGMRDFVDLLTKKVEETVSRIKLDFTEPRNVNKTHGKGKGRGKQNGQH